MSQNKLLPLFLVPPVVLTPILLETYKYYYLPDLFFSALLALFFLSISRRGINSLSIILLFMMVLSRESSALLLALVIVVIYWLNFRRKTILPVAAACGAGIVVVQYFSGFGKPNIHGVGNLLYLILKFVFNFLENIVGLKVVVNTFAEFDPVYTVKLPEWLQFGLVDTLGFNGWYPMEQVYTLLALITRFGIGLVLFFFMAKYGRAQFKRFPLWAQIVVIYGLVSFFLAPFLGPDTSRLVAYAWPVFWIVVPLLLLKILKTDRTVFRKLILLHILLCWIPFVRDAFLLYENIFMILSLLLAGLLQFVAYRILRGLPPESFELDFITRKVPVEELNKMEEM
ncbi:hypothetical protein ACFLT9_09085 [Acidobacteriota bacterium]